MKVWKVMAAGLFGLCIHQAAQAQTFSRVPSAEEQCMTPGPAERGAPVYPEKMLARRDVANVQVELSFSGPDQAPRVTLLADTANEEFFDAVKDYVQRFRVPCMQPGAPRVRIPMDFVFTVSSGRKVFFHTKESSEDLNRRKTLMACLKVPSSKVVSYPPSALRREIQGLVILELNFTDAASPPTVKVIHDGGSAQFVSALQRFIDEMRLSCLPAGEQFGVGYEFSFIISGGARAWLKDTALPDFLAMVKGIREKKGYFDFNTMGCPFVLNFALRQPYLQNKVGQVGEFQISREPFTDWLSQLDLDVPDTQRELVMLHDSAITVPCIKLDL
jgi:hypothetical protein